MLYMRQYRKRTKERLELQDNLQKALIMGIGECPKCKSNLVVFVTAKRIPLCLEHWNSLADSDIEWSSEGLDVNPKQ